MTENLDNKNHLYDPVTKYVYTDFPKLTQGLTVERALRIIRSEGIGERIVYFYVLDDNGVLIGIVPARRLLISNPDVRIGDLMIADPVTVRSTATILEVCEMFVKHKLLAFPVVDSLGHMIGVVDAGLFSEEELTFAQRENFDDVFALIGYGLSQIKDKSAFGLFRYRFPWLLATLGSGVLCAVLTGVYEKTLAEAIALAFFITLVLALGESVSIQTMTVALQNLHHREPDLQSYLRTLRVELGATLLLGFACAAIAGTIAFAWRGDILPALAIGLTIQLSVVLAGFIGLTVPTALHAVHEESKIAAGPFTLAATDISTILLYFNIAVVLV